MTRKDVKRTLVLWPSIASAAVIAASTLPGFMTKQERNARVAGIIAAESLKASSQVWITVDEAKRWWQDERRWKEAACDGQPGLANTKARLPKPLEMQHQETLAQSDADCCYLTLGRTQATHRRSGGRAALTPPPRLAADANTPISAPLIDIRAELAGYTGEAWSVCVPDHDVISGLGTVPSRNVPSSQAKLPASGPSLGSPESGVTGSILDVRESRDAEIPAGLTAGQTLSLPASVAALAKPRMTPSAYDIIDAGTGHPASVLGLPRRLDSPQSVSPSHQRIAVRTVDRARAIENPAAWPIAQSLRLQLATMDDRAAKHGSPSEMTLVSASRERDLRLNTSDLNESLDRQLDTAASIRRHAVAMIMARWARRVESRLSDLQKLARIGDPEARALIHELATLAEAGLRLAERVPDRGQQVHWLQTAHGLSRRVSVWGAVWELNQVNAPEATLNTGLAIGEVVDEVVAELSATGDATGWRQYLLIDEIARLDENAVEYDERALLAQRFLSRLNHHRLHPSHQAWLTTSSVADLARALQPWAVKPIDHALLLKDLERREVDAIDLASIKVADAFQSLRFTDQLASTRLAKAIDVNYRNANLRTAISEDFLSRFLPKVPEQTKPVSMNVLGSRVRGTSHVQSVLGISLLPADDRWSLLLQNSGRVDTTSTATQSPARLRTRSNARFNSHTPITISPDGYTIAPTRVDANGRNQLRSIRTDYDSWPLIGSLVRAIAEDRFRTQRGSAQSIADFKLRSDVATEMDTEMSGRATAAEARLHDWVLGPLGRVELDPRVIDMRTTQDRLIARYRIAGDWQLAAYTPRPRALRNSLLSVQLHQSALNNLLERLLPTKDAESFGSLFLRLTRLFGQPHVELPGDIPSDASIQFAGTRPMTVEIQDGQAWLTFRVMDLSVDDGPRLRRFIVRAAYRPAVEGMEAHLVREGHLRISGPGMSIRQRLPVRAIFNKILSPDRTIPLTIPAFANHPAVQDISVQQLELRDGWLNLSLAKKPAAGLDAIASLQ
ncbi:MAG: hypothetical protein AAGD07_12540 [Planctomycetota bacterium]